MRHLRYVTFLCKNTLVIFSFKQASPLSETTVRAESYCALACRQHSDCVGYAVSDDGSNVGCR